MKAIERIERLKKLDNLIREKSKGTPQELGQHLGISRSVLYTYIDDLKSMGASIRYSKKYKCFEYENDFALKF